jgi:hypothetical protein
MFAVRVPQTLRFASGPGGPFPLTPGLLSLLRLALFGLAWTIVTVVSAYDSYFAWKFRAVFQEWELNPLARSLAQCHGVEAVLVFKAAVMLFALSVAIYCHRHRQWLNAFYTLAVCSVHLALGYHYLTAYLQDPWH